MKIKCYVPTCENTTEWSFLNWIYGVLVTRSLHPYVCPDHHGLFDEVENLHQESSQ